MLFKASTPGSMMLLGEYAVLHGKNALVCAVDKRMTISLQPRSDQIININSARLGSLTTHISDLKVVPPFLFVLSALKKFQKHLKFGCDITIEAEFCDTIGLGSSAAVTVGMVAVLSKWLKLSYSDLDLIKESRKIIRQVQGLGSGADAAACVLGGIVHYKMQPLLATKFSYTPAITVVYSGYKTTTVQAVAEMKNKFQAQPALYKKIFNVIDECVLQAVKAIEKQDAETLGKIFNIQQGLMQSLGVSTSLLTEIVDKLNQQKNMLGAKISGSGLGDCIMGLGNISEALSFSSPDARLISAQITNQGVTCEEV
ncbi:MAG: mevalonate kinase [Gammaproteobacteria bacterium]|nr:mevalonate kinase [Gammaproteobacteria bacterium]